MKILYIGQANPGTTCFDRMEALRRLGHDVTPFDVTAYAARGRLLRRVQAKYAPRPLLAALNRDLARRCWQLGRLDMAWVDKGTWILPEVVSDIRRRFGAITVHYTADAQLVDNVTTHFLRSLPHYDHAITTKAFEVDLYRKHGANNVILTTQSYCPLRFANPQSDARFRCEVGLISSFKWHYGFVLRSLIQEKVDVGIWGPRWRRSSLIGIPPRMIRASGVWGDDYVRALASFDVGLGLLSKAIPEQHTTRTFEIPAAGTFLLAERTDEHCALFEEGNEAEFFSTIAELHDKVAFYLRDSTARMRIASAGRARCLRSGYDNDSVLRAVMKKIAS